MKLYCATLSSSSASLKFLCATSVFSVSLWLYPGKSPQRHREHRGCTEKTFRIIPKTALTCPCSSLRLCAAQTSCGLLTRSSRDQHPYWPRTHYQTPVGAQAIASLSPRRPLMLTHSRRSQIASLVMFALLLPIILPSLA